jgi:hypothetical protein
MRIGSGAMAAKASAARGGVAAKGGGGTGASRRLGSKASREQAAADLERRLEEIRALSGRPASDRAAQREGLRQALRKAYHVHRKSEADAGWRAALEAAFKERGVRARAGSNPFTRLVKLCFPGRRPADYHRYAAVLRLAEHEGWGTKELEGALAEPRATLARLSRRASRLGNPAPARRSPYERGRGLLEEAEPLGEFEADPAGKPGLVLLIGEVDEAGEGVVRRVVRGRDAVLRRLVVSIGRARQ